MKVDVYCGRDGRWRWRARAANGRIVADSGEGYARQRDVTRALRRLIPALIGAYADLALPPPPRQKSQAATFVPVRSTSAKR
jgi:uncharacterized protein YegP (UPF0339 family)